MFNALDISTSALVAQRVRINTIAMNLANSETVFDPAENGPFKRRSIKFAAEPEGKGVRVAGIEKQAVYRTVYDPTNPYADENGMVKMPGIEPLLERLNGMEAQRAYEANIAAMDISKAMLNSALRILA